MKILKGILLVALAFVLIGSRSIQANGPVPLHEQNVYTHAGTEMIFPEHIGKFQRVQITQFAPDEKDVGVGYNLYDPVSPISATVYIYLAPSVVSTGSSPEVVEAAKALMFHSHLNDVKQEIMQVHPDAKLISENSCVVTIGEQSRKGQKVTFEFAYVFGTKPQDSISQLYLFQNDGWMIKYRFTFPKATAATSEAVVMDFLKKLAWPTKGKS
jgi:hypothetical protein